MKRLAEAENAPVVPDERFSVMEAPVLKLGGGMKTVSMNGGPPQEPKIIQIGRAGNEERKARVEALMAEYESLTAEHPWTYGDRLTQNAVLTVVRDGGSIHLRSIRAMQPGGGGGTQALALVCGLADKHNVKVTLTAKAVGDDPALNTKQLMQWYGRYGFEEDADSFGDEEDGFDMTRHPAA